MSEKKYPKHHKSRKLPVEPLLTMFRHDMTETEIAAAVKKHPTTVRNWRINGIPQYIADEVACHMGVHPSHIWGEQWWQSISIT